MSNWTAGYVADIGYTYGYYTELNPLRLKLAFLKAGLIAPTVMNACELGFGQGLSVNVHAAASGVQWSGTDFNPSQAAFAQELARDAESGARLYDDAFLEFSNRKDLPDFDYIGLHGIWSWISDENRAVIVDFIRRKLKVGGVLYISYNTMPGWASFAPMRHLITQHAEVMGTTGNGILKRVDGALEFAEKLMQTEPLYAKANPLVNERLKQVKAQNNHYLAHEYFNKDWHPMHFSTMAEWLEPAKLGFACSAHYLTHIDVVNLTPEQQQLLNELPDPMFRESTRDFMVNQQFRRDYWVKGPRKLGAVETTESWRDQRLILVTPPADISLEIAGILGKATMSETVYKPILDLMGDYKIRTFRQIEEAMAPHGIVFLQLQQAVMILADGGHLLAAQDEPTVKAARKKCDRLNYAIKKKSQESSEISFLASPVTGSGIIITRFPQLFLLAIDAGKTKPADMAAHAWRLLLVCGQKLVNEGKTLETPEENLAELTRQAEEFFQKKLPILKALQIA